MSKIDINLTPGQHIRESLSAGVYLLTFSSNANLYFETVDRKFIHRVAFIDSSKFYSYLIEVEEGNLLLGHGNDYQLTCISNKFSQWQFREIANWNSL